MKAAVKPRVKIRLCPNDQPQQCGSEEAQPNSHPAWNHRPAAAGATHPTALHDHHFLSPPLRACMKNGGGTGYQPVFGGNLPPKIPAEQAGGPVPHTDWIFHTGSKSHKSALLRRLIRREGSRRSPRQDRRADQSLPLPVPRTKTSRPHSAKSLMNAASR